MKKLLGTAAIAAIMMAGLATPAIATHIEGHLKLEVGGPKEGGGGPVERIRSDAGCGNGQEDGDPTLQSTANNQSPEGVDGVDESLVGAQCSGRDLPQ